MKCLYKVFFIICTFFYNYSFANDFSDSISFPISVEKYDSNFTKESKKYIKLLKENNFIELENKLDNLLVDVLENPKEEYELLMGYKYISNINTDVETYLTKWLKERPNSYQAYLANSMFAKDKAWEFRGTDYMRNVKEDNAKNFRRLIEIATDLAEKSIELKPNNILAYYILASSKCSVGGFTCVMDLASKANDYAKQSYYFNRVILYYSTPIWGGSNEIIGKYLDYLKREGIFNKYKYLKPLLGYQSHSKARTLINSKDYEKALVENKKALSYGNDFDYLDRQISILSHLERLDEAKKYYDLKLKLYPLSENDIYDNFYLFAVMNKARKLQRKGSYKKSREYMEPALLYRPIHIDLLELYGLSLISDYNDYNDNKSAEKVFKLANKLYPESRYSVKMLDNILSVDKRWDEIVTLWKAYLLLKPDDALAHMEISGTYYNLRNKEMDKLHLKKACDLGNDYSCKRFKRHYK